MSDDLRFERSTRDWLELGPIEAPPSVVQAALLEIDSTPQERDLWIPWRFPMLSSPSRAVLAAVLGVLLVGSAFLIYQRPSLDSAGGVAPNPTVSLTTSPSPATPSPSASPLPSITSDDVGTTLQPGRYQVEGFAVPFAVTLPAGWIVSDLSPNSITIGRKTDGSVNLYMAVADKAYRDPCHPTSKPAAIGPDVDALVAALSAMPQFHVADLHEATVGGAAGKSFTFRNSINTSAANCSKNPLPLMTYDKNGTNVDISMFGGESDTFWVLDASGTRVFMAVTDSKASTLQPVVDSLSFGAGSAS